MMPPPDFLSTLPLELILTIAEDLPSVQDERNLTLTSRHLFTLLTPHLLSYALLDEPAFPGFVAAAEKGQLDSLRMFLRHDTQCNGKFLTPDLKVTALFWACSRGHNDAVKLLLDAGADPNHPVKSNGNCTALHEAVYAEDPALIRTLLGTGRVDANARDDDGWTPLHHAACCRSSEVIRLLVEVGNVDVDARDHKGETALYIACVTAGSYPAIARVLVELGADRGVRDAEGRTAEEALEYSILMRLGNDHLRWRRCLEILREGC